MKSFILKCCFVSLSVFQILAETVSLFGQSEVLLLSPNVFFFSVPLLGQFAPEREKTHKCYFYINSIHIVLFVFAFLFCSPESEQKPTTKPPQQLSTPITSGDVNVTELIANLLTGYDKKLRPNFGGEENVCLLITFVEAVSYFVSYECVSRHAVRLEARWVMS